MSELLTALAEFVRIVTGAAFGIAAIFLLCNVLRTLMRPEDYERRRQANRKRICEVKLFHEALKKY